MNNEIRRLGPVVFPGAARAGQRNGFEVVLEYDGQGGGPWLADLSHVPKWDIRAADFSDIRIWGRPAPAGPGECLTEKGGLIGRLDATRVLALDLACRAGGIGTPLATEITDGLCLLAVVGEAAAVMERVTPLDVFAPGAAPPVWIQGPLLHVPCHLVRLARAGDRDVVLIGVARGYGQSLAQGILAAGRDLGLVPGGWEVFGRLWDG